MSFEPPRLKSSSLENNDEHGSYATSLINPENSSIDFSFNGGQVVNLTLTNSNILGVGGSISCHTIFDGDSSYWLPPMGSTTKRYDMFGTTPIWWRFTVSTISDAAIINIVAKW